MITLRKTWLLPAVLFALAGSPEESRALGTTSSGEIAGGITQVSDTHLAGGDLTPAVSIDPKTISAKQNHTCALDQSGKAYCWGVNTDGQL